MGTAVNTALVNEAESVAAALFETTEGRSNPYPLYHRLRELAPVHHSETARGWLLTRYDDCHAVLRDPRFEKRYEEALDARSRHWRERPALVWAGRTLLNLDGPLHTRLRRQVVRSFTRGSVEALRPTVEAMTDQLLDDLAGSGGGELMERFAFRLPIAVIGELLGLPPSDLPQFRARVLALTAAFEMRASREMKDAADVAALESIAYFDDLIAAKRTNPGDDLISRLVRHPDDPDEEPLTDEEINTLAMLLLFAGFETTTNLIGNGVLALLDQPDQLNLLRAQPELCAHLSDELLRHGGTVQVVNRFTTEDVTIGDTTIPGGESVYALLGAANRDPARYADPDRLDVTRTNIRPVSFGGGVHYCLGAALAAMEIETVFRKLVERFDVAELAEARPPHRDRLTLRGPSEVTIRLGHRSAAGGEQLGARPGGDDSAWRAAYRRRSERAVGPLDPEELVHRVTLLERIPLFAGCRAGDLALLAATAYSIAFDPGDELCVEGGDADDCYVIVEGEARVTIDGLAVATVGADEVVGERGPIADLPRAATVTATTHLLTFVISRDRLHQVMESSPAASAVMKEVIAGRYGG
ncbi:MAG TPA: cytochrome P450 [Mycobacteriales bacterium]|nr:cytochrome P450 [Mycobacteriales bacterium]